MFGITRRADACVALIAIIALTGLLPGRAEAVSLSNGSMTEGGDQPTGWTATYVSRGELRVVRDTEVFASPPASLRLESVGGPADGNCNQKLHDAAGQTFTVRGKLRARGVDSASVAVMVQDQNWQMARWQTLAGASGTSDWKQFEAVVTVPPNARNTMLMLLLKGEGIAWLDDVEVQSGLAAVDPIDVSRFDGPPPRISHVSAVAPDILALTVRAREHVPGSFKPYEPQPGDSLRPIDEPGSARQLVRNGEQVGLVVGTDALWLSTDGEVTGQPLAVQFVDDPANYTISSPHDPAYASGATPLHVWRKSQPVAPGPDRHWPLRHDIYLHLPKPLITGRTYKVNVSRLNMRPSTVQYRHEPQRVRTQAIHVSQIGFHPRERAKRAYLSLWMGLGGPCIAYREGMGFRLINENSGETVYRGTTELALARDQVSPGRHAGGRNLNGTDVYVLDFSDFDGPGRFRVYVEGIGCSYPFSIAETTWEQAFRTSARGFYHQRSGIAMEQPYTDWTRPRGFHPEDGKTVYHSDVRLFEPANQSDVFRQLVANRTERTVPDAWGGYFDAGDWDRRIQHMAATRNQLELLEMHPDYFKNLDLNIPESNNNLPDLLDEALWNLDCYRRMQTPAGGIRGGIESESHPAPGETSWTDSLALMAFAPDYRSSWIYAGVAARAAHWLGLNGHPERAELYGNSAVKAMEWAEADYSKRHPDESYANWKECDDRNLAALELYRLTGEARWRELFRATCGFREGPSVFEWGDHVQRDAAFLYARLGLELTDGQLRRNAVAGLMAEADWAAEFVGKTAFGWCLSDEGSPLGIGALGAPQAASLVRGHALSGEAKYLRAVSLACQYSAGANPMNMCLTSGVGVNPVRNLLHVDARRTGRRPSPGITAYGPLDLQFFGAPDWVTRWKLIPYVNLTPPIGEWPVTEAYWDMHDWPLMCEFTIHQTMAPTVYAWGHLAACYCGGD